MPDNTGRARRQLRTNVTFLAVLLCALTVATAVNILTSSADPGQTSAAVSALVVATAGIAATAVRSVRVVVSRIHSGPSTPAL